MDGKSVKQVVVHTFKMSDVEDPDIYAYEPLKQFENSEKGKWVLEHAVDTPVWTKTPDFGGWGWTFKITATFKGPALTEWILKYGNDV
jgi:hypothetical protein